MHGVLYLEVILWSHSITTVTHYFSSFFCRNFLLGTVLVLVATILYSRPPKQDLLPTNEKK